MSVPTSDKSAPRIDLLTVCSVAIIVYFLCCFLHEAAGHGGMATLLGVKVTRVTNAYCSQQDASEFQGRLIASGGILLNTIVGLLAIAVRSRMPRRENSVLHYFIWLLAHMNLLTAGGYMASFSFLRIGDLHAVVHDLPYERLIRAAIFLVGIALIIWTFRQAGRTLTEFTGQGSERFRRARILTIVPYFVGGLVNVGVSLLGVGKVPLDMVLMSSIGASFGGNFPLLWIPTAMWWPAEQDPPTVMTPTRSIPWLTAGSMSLGLYVLLGRGIDF